MAGMQNAQRNYYVMVYALVVLYWIALFAGLWRVRANGPLIAFGLLWSTLAHALLWVMYRYWGPHMLPSFITTGEPREISVVVHVPPINAKQRDRKFVLLWCAATPDKLSSDEDGVYLVAAHVTPGRYTARVRENTPFIYVERSGLADGKLEITDWRLLNPPKQV